jgi:hypothetical protein
MTMGEYIFRIDVAACQDPDAVTRELENIWSEVQDLFLNDFQCQLTLNHLWAIHSRIGYHGVAVTVDTRIQSVDFVCEELWRKVGQL